MQAPVRSDPVVDSASAAHPAERTARAVARLLRPLARLLVGRVACIYVVDRFRRLYLEEARAYLERSQPGQRVTRSKLAMLTGLDTRTIAAMEGERADSSLLAQEVCAGSVVIDRWLTQADFQAPDGGPAVLALLGPGRSFQALTARAVGRNITVHTVLEQLLESGNVEVDADGRVHLVDRVYRPVRPSEQTVLDTGSHSIARLTETVCHNMASAGGPGARLQQERRTARVPEARFDELDAQARALVQRHIAEMERLLAEYETTEEGAGTKSLGVGWYVFE